MIVADLDEVVFPFADQVILPVFVSKDKPVVVVTLYFEKESSSVPDATVLEPALAEVTPFHT